MSQQYDNTLARFMSKVTPEPNTGCWLWVGQTTGESNGNYGRLKVNGKNVPAHRVSWMLHVGPIPEGMIVCHKCDTPLCANPSHLFLGTTKENMADKVIKGRQAKGSHNGNSKLSESVVLQIRQSAGPQRAIARKFGVSQALVSKIKRNEMWRHLNG